MARKPIATFTRAEFDQRCLLACERADIIESRRKPLDREFSVEASQPRDSYVEVLGPFALHEAFRAASTYDREYYVRMYVIGRDFPDAGVQAARSRVLRRH